MNPSLRSTPSRRRFVLASVALAVVAGAALVQAQGAPASDARIVPAFAGAAAAASPNAAESETAVLAGGCFWGVQGVFQHVNGVTQAVSGYAGGAKKDASYDAVSTGSTGHAEAVRVTFDPRRISYARVLQIYFSVAHDPTQLNRQGPDHGTQYRSAIFPSSPQQQAVAQDYIAQLGKARVWSAPIVTKIEPGRPFFTAEDYHQDFLVLNPRYPYIVYNDLPKIEDLKRMFPTDYRTDPVLVSASRKAG